MSHYNKQYDNLRASLNRLEDIKKSKQLQSQAQVDAVNSPKHYTQSKSGVECIQITEHLNFCIGNAIKYLWRSEDKNNKIEDLKKAIWYINREIGRIENEDKDKGNIGPAGAGGSGPIC